MTPRRRGRRLAAGVMILGACLTSAGCGGRVPGGPEPSRTDEPAPPGRLTTFGSEAELRNFLRDRPRSPLAGFKSFGQSFSGLTAGYMFQAPAVSTSVTNVQHAGVDEGDIVKVHGQHLVVLRRGRLFTVRIGADRLTRVSIVDAFAPDIDPDGAWYDEMLVSANTVVVVGYSYARGGTELGLFDIDAGGRLAYRATYHLRSQDYYSSRNYASRLLGRRLVFYIPLGMPESDPLSVLPMLRKWHPGARESEFVPIYSPRRLYRPLTSSPLLVLHSVVTCDLAQAELTCAATGVMGPPGRVFYVSPSAVYVWMTDDWWSRSGGPSWLYRLPLNGGEPGAVRVSGAPIDQLSFLEDARHLNVVVRAEGAGEGMWRSEMARGGVALLRLPLSSFGEADAVAPFWRYRPLPAPANYGFQNRFVGAYLLYGAGTGWEAQPGAPAAEVFVHEYAAGSDAVAVPVGHSVERIEALGEDAVVVGRAGGDLHVSSIRLDRRPTVAGRHVARNAAQGEWRSHGFFYRSDDRGTGILGLPVRAAGGHPGAHLTEGSASVLFLRNEGLALHELGRLRAEPARAITDACRASCVDWYGNARPLFLGGRIFALLGYEIVEGGLIGHRLDEIRRLDFAPPPAAERSDGGHV